MSDQTTPEQFHSKLIPMEKATSPLGASRMKNHGTIQPRTVTFGEVEATEDMQHDLLLSSERAAYQSGFDTLKSLVTSGNEMEKMILLHPHLASALIGIQPWAQIDMGEAALLHQAFQKAEPELQQHYRLFEEPSKHGNNRFSFINLDAARNVLEQYRTELPDIPEGSLTRENTIECLHRLFNHPEGTVRVLARGLLSGFPIEDCKKDTVDYADPAVALHEISDWNKYFTSKTTFQALGKQISLNPASIVDTRYYGRNFYGNQFLPDYAYVDTKSNDVLPAKPEIALKKDSSETVDIHGFGLLWLTSNPPREAAIKQCQKVLQIDRELGVLDFVTEARQSINFEKNIQEIKFGKFMSSMGTRGVYRAREDLQHIAGSIRGFLPNVRK